MNIFKWFQRDTTHDDTMERIRLLTERTDALRNRGKQLQEFSAYLDFKLNYIKNTALDRDTQDVLYQGCVTQTKHYLTPYHDLVREGSELNKEITEELSL